MTVKYQPNPANPSVLRAGKIAVGKRYFRIGEIVDAPATLLEAMSQPQNGLPPVLITVEYGMFAKEEVVTAKEMKAVPSVAPSKLPPDPQSPTPEPDAAPGQVAGEEIGENEIPETLRGVRVEEAVQSIAKAEEPPRKIRRKGRKG